MTTPCAHPLVELLSVNGRNLDGATRRCAFCGADPECPNCGEDHAATTCTWTPSCHDCDHPTGDLDAAVCADCQASRERIAARDRQRDEYDAHCERLGDEMREGRG